MEAFFTTADESIKRLYRRGQDPEDTAVPSTFTWTSFSEIPARNLYNMDEIGADTTQARKRKIVGAHSMQDALRHNFEETDGDKAPFHVTLCLTTCATGLTPIPPYIGHSNPSSKDEEPRLLRRHLEGIFQTIDGKVVNPSGINVFVTKLGSMTKRRFPGFCQHFVKNLPRGQGKGGEPVILVFDGHTSRWSVQGLKFLFDNNVYCICLPGHTSIWSQPNDGGPNSSFKSLLGDCIHRWHLCHLALPGAQTLMKMKRGDFNEIACEAWLAWSERQRKEKELSGNNSIMTAWKGTGLKPFNRNPPYWLSALQKFGQKESIALMSTPCPSASEIQCEYASTASSDMQVQALPHLQAPTEATNTGLAEKDGSIPNFTYFSLLAHAFVAATAKKEQNMANRTNTLQGHQQQQCENACSLSILTATKTRSALVAAMATTMQSTLESTRREQFRSRLEAMLPGQALALHKAPPPAGIEASKEATTHAVATLIPLVGNNFKLVYHDPAQNTCTLTLEEAAALAPKYLLPATSMAELSVVDAKAVRARKAREAVAAREAAERAAAHAATVEWCKEQAEFAISKGITFETFVELSKVWAKAPARLVNGKIVLNYKDANGHTRAHIVDETIRTILSQPLMESVKAAVERAGALHAQTKRREKGLDQDTWAGRDVTEFIPELERLEKQEAAKARTKLQKKAERTCKQNENREEKIKAACSNLLSDRLAGNPAKLPIADLVTLIKWKNSKKVPTNTKAGNRSQIVQAWVDLNVPMEELRAKAGAPL